MDHLNQFHQLPDSSRKCNKHHDKELVGEHKQSAKGDHCFSRGHNRSSAALCLNHRKGKIEIAKRELAAGGAGESLRTFTRKAYLGGTGSDDVFHRGIFNPEVPERGIFICNVPFTNT